jgi:DNA replication protein DnaC
MQKAKNTTSHASNKYKCDICSDTGFIQVGTGYKRCECYEQDYIKRLWQNFGVNPSDIKLLRDYEPYNEITRKAKQQAAEFITKFSTLDKGTNFVLMGQAGGGKTHIVLAIGKALLDKKIKVIYAPYLEAIRELKANAMDDEYYNKILNRYKKAEILIIDDLFKDKVKKGRLTGELTEADMRHIYPILNYRYSNKLTTLISTECTPNMLIELDEALAGRILERCGKSFGIVFNDKCNYRLKQFTE